MLRVPQARIYRSWMSRVGALDRMIARRRPAAAASRDGRDRRWLAMVVALLVSLFGQSLVTQTHVHLDPVARGTAARVLPGQPAARLEHRHRASHGPATCPLCREIAQAGHYVAPASVGPASVAPFAPLFLLPARATVGGLVRSHAWRSRGPPTLLLA